MDRSKRIYWDNVAKSQQGPSLPPPIKPASVDIEYFEARARFLHRDLGGRPLEVLMLGVTPGIAAMRWPDQTRLIALDWSAGMIRRRWPASGRPAGSQPIMGDWRQMPFATASLDLVIGDGCYMSGASFEDCELLHREVWRVLRPEGRFCMRCFLRPEQPESIDALFAALHDGRIGSFDVFRWRLAMALHGNDRQGVRGDDVWRLWHARVPEVRPLLERRGWTEQTVLTIERWKGLQARSPMPTLEEARAMLAPQFELLECSVPDYEMGECCPRLLMQPRPRT